MSSRKMIARVDMRYGTRRLKAGDVFQARQGHAKYFSLKKRADYVDEGREKALLPPIPETLRNRAMAGKFDHDGDGKPGGSPKVDNTDEVRALRAEYTEKMGKRPFSGWDADELRRRMAGDQ